MTALADAEAIVVRALPTVASLTGERGGLSGAYAAAGRDAEGNKVAFVKWARDSCGESAQSVRREGSNLRRVTGVPGVVRLVLFDEATPLVVTQFAQGKESYRWTQETWDLASPVLDQVGGVAESGLAPVREWKAFSPRGELIGDSLESLGVSGSLATELERQYNAVPQNLDSGVSCHSDPHPGNWLVGPAEVTLIDFEHMASGPAGFDEVFALTHVDAAAETRLSWLDEAGVDKRLAAMVSAALTCRIACGVYSTSEPWSSWCRARWPAAIALASALL